MLKLLRRRGVPHKPGGCDYEGWELHTHPDLVQRLADLAPQWSVLATFGVPVLAAKGIAAALAQGTGTLLVRLPEAPTASLTPARPCPPLTDPSGDWYSLDPWQGELPSVESKRLLARVIQHALSHAASMSDDDSVDWRGHPVQDPPGRP
ncbi:hypothetical protein ACFY3E_19825 [Streptomyces griseorubiginosus]|uniref:hypothetical protein n=1 Tax=Streptomyces griseorubiginosus TaxID=67304 RepID=UPI00368A20A0